MKPVFDINETVIINGYSVYDQTNKYSEEFGVVMKIRHRYKDTKNECFQYKIKLDRFSRKFNLDNLEYLFSEHSISRINKI